MKIIRRIYSKILDSYPLPPPEQGGILGIRDGVICEYYHDCSGNTTDQAVYEPDVETLNKILAEWEERGIQFAGMVHSHLLGQESLSSGDKEYVKVLFDALPLDMNKLYFPIVIPESDKIISFIAERKNMDIIIRTDEIYIVQ
jgi:hypothetical protein